MKQVLQDLSEGRIYLEDVPTPAVRRGHLLIQTEASLISAGTERMLLEFGRSSWIDRARQQPDKVRQVLQKVQTDGLVSTLEAVRGKLSQPMTLGYSNCGRVIAIGADVEGFALGDLVVSNGKHAEMVCVPKNLCAKVPEVLAAAEASFAVVGAIGLQAVRLCAPALGETAVVLGLGLIGLMVAQILKSSGCRVIGFDYDLSRVELAKGFGCEAIQLNDSVDSVEMVQHMSRGAGADLVIIAAATQSDEPVSQAARMSRKRGRIVLVGVCGLNLSRADFYEKELSFQVSCSYGPGRYDPLYEEGGQDYPRAFVRFTAQRNFESILMLMADGKIDVRPLLSRQFELTEVEQAYDSLMNERSALGIVLNYAKQEQIHKDTIQFKIEGSVKNGIGWLGAGNYSSQVLLPAFSKAGAQFTIIGSRTGLSASVCARKFGFQTSTSDPEKVFNEKNNIIVVATQHDSHGAYALKALEQKKHCFVEKPLSLNGLEIDQIDQMARSNPDGPLLMVGFNRRFSPLALEMRKILQAHESPLAIIYLVNSGHIPVTHWSQSKNAGGGRLVGECCHFVDFCRFLTGSPVESYTVTALRSKSDPVADDKVSIQISYQNGSIATIHYLANGHRSFPKERVEVFQAGRIVRLDNFRRLEAFGVKGFKNRSLWTQDKGQNQCVAEFLRVAREGGQWPIALEEMIETSRIVVDLAAKISHLR